MKNGMKFNGVHSSTFDGATVKTRDRPIMPAPKLASYEADNMNGDIDFTDYTGLTYYQKRTITVDFQIAGNSIYNLQNRMNAILTAYSGKGEIVFDDMPYVIWTGRISDTVSYMPEHGGRMAVLTVSFLCEPFSKFNREAIEGITLGDRIALGANLILGAPEHYTVLKGNNEIILEGDVPIRPKFVKTGTGAWTIRVRNSLGTRVLDCLYFYDTTADCEKQQIYTTEEGTNLMTYTDGDFPILMPHETNHIYTSHDMKIHYTPQFFYNGGLS